MHNFFKLIGWVLILGGLAGGIGAYFFVSSQEFVLSLLARIVERPFEYRTYLAILTAGGVLTIGCLIGMIYVGMARILEQGRNELR